MALSDPPIGRDAGRAPRRDAQRNRAALIAAGSELFDAAGMLPTLDDVARDAGLGVGTAYRHFADKYALARAVLADTIDSMLESADRAARSEDAVAGLAAFFEAILEPQAHKRALGRLLRRAHEDGDGPDVRGRIERGVTELLRRGQAQRTIRAEVEATDIGVLLAMLADVIETFGDADPDLWRRLVPIVLDGLRAEAPTPLPGRALTVPAYLERLTRGD